MKTTEESLLAENLLRAALLWPVLWFEYIINFAQKNGFDVILDEIKKSLLSVIDKLSPAK